MGGGGLGAVNSQIATQRIKSATTEVQTRSRPVQFTSNSSLSIGQISKFICFQQPIVTSFRWPKNARKAYVTKFLTPSAPHFTANSNKLCSLTLCFAGNISSFGRSLLHVDLNVSVTETKHLRNGDRWGKKVLRRSDILSQSEDKYTYRSRLYRVLLTSLQYYCNPFR